MAIDVYYIRISSLNCNTLVHTQKKRKNLGTLFDAKRKTSYSFSFLEAIFYVERKFPAKKKKNTKKYGKRTVSRRLVRHEELTTMRSPLLPWHFLSLGFRIVFLSNLFRSLFSPVTGTERLVRQKSNTHKRPAYSIVYKGNVFFFFFPSGMGSTHPSHKICQTRKENVCPTTAKRQ